MGFGALGHLKQATPCPASGRPNGHETDALELLGARSSGFATRGAPSPWVAVSRDHAFRCHPLAPPPLEYVPNVLLKSGEEYGR